MTLQQLRDFLAVLAHGGFRPAARALSVSQAGLTKSVARLEEEFGFGLLSRTPDGVALTPQGEGFLPHAQAVLGECERAQQWVRDAGVRSPRRVALGVSIEPSLSLAPSVVADFRRAMPGVTVHVSQASVTELLAGLRDGRFELAVMRLPDAASLDDMRVEGLYDAPAAIVARPGHSRAGARTVAELVDADWLVVGDPAQPGLDDVSIRELFLEHRLGTPRVVAVLDSLFGAVAMLAESDLVARLPRSVLEHPLAAGLLQEIPVREQTVHEIGLVRRGNRRLDKEARLLWSMLKSFARVRRAIGSPPAAVAPRGRATG